MTFALAAALAAAMASADGRIKSVEVTPRAGGLEVVVSGVDLAKPKEIRLRQGQAFVAEFDAHLDIPGFRRRVSAGGVSMVEVGWFDNRPPKVRVSLRLDPLIQPVIVESEGKWIIRTGNEPLAPAAVVPATKPSSLLDDFPSNVPPIPAAAKPQTAAASPEASAQKSASVPPPTVKTAPSTLTAADTAVKAGTGQLPPAPRTNPQGAGRTAPAPQAKPETRVNLEFVGTDVVQILRALSAEAGVNIVTAPDVSPTDKPSRLTVSLKGVTVSDALSYVTIMSSLKYAKINNTFFVTRSENFASTMREFFRGREGFETRVVNLLSGEAAQIRQAVLATYPQDGSEGFYDIIDPSQPQNTGAQGAGAPGASGAQPGKVELPVWMNFGPGIQPGNTPDAQPGAGAANKPEPGKSSYVIVMGDKRRVDQISQAASELDRKIVGTFSVGRSEDSGAEAVPILSGQTKQIKEMLEKLLTSHPRRRDFSFNESALRELSEGELTTSVLLMIGPKSELAVLKQYAMTLDENLCRTAGIAYSANQTELEREYAIIRLNYIEPVMAAFDLKNRIRGLYVTVLPDPVTPALVLGEATDEKRDATKAPGDGAGAPQEQAKKDEIKKTLGREPMALVVRGTRQQVEEAKRYVELVDIAPKQVAFELRVLEMTKEDALRLGLNWDILTGGRLAQFSVTQGQPDSTGGTTLGGQYRFRGADVANFLGTLDKLDAGRRIIARPNALATDGRPVDLFVGDTVRYVESIQSTQNGITVQTNSIDVGVKFNLISRVGSNGSIAIDLNQEFILLNGFTPVAGGGQLPQTSERRSRQFVNMQAGEVIAFGGLIQEQDRKRVSGIPILKDLPLIGYLFSRTENTKVRTEIVFILAAVEVDATNRPDAASPRRTSIAVPDPLKKYQDGGGRP